MAPKSCLSPVAWGRMTLRMWLVDVEREMADRAAMWAKLQFTALSAVKYAEASEG